MVVATVVKVEVVAAVDPTVAVVVEVVAIQAQAVMEVLLPLQSQMQPQAPAVAEVVAVVLYNPPAHKVMVATVVALVYLVKVLTEQQERQRQSPLMVHPVQAAHSSYTARVAAGGIQPVV